MTVSASAKKNSENIVTRSGHLLYNLGLAATVVCGVAAVVTGGASLALTGTGFLAKAAGIGAVTPTGAAWIATASTITKALWSASATCLHVLPGAAAAIPAGLVIKAIGLAVSPRSPQGMANVRRFPDPTV
jgi:hypothetical protein